MSDDTKQKLPRARLLGRGLTWEEMTLGARFRTFGRTVTEADMVAFLGCSGISEVLFTDLTYGDLHGAIRGRVVPGAFIYAIAEGLVINSSVNGTGLAFLHAELNILGPTVVGDTIRVEFEVIEQRPTKKAGRGLVRTRNLVVNQRGETVLEYNPLRMMVGREVDHLALDQTLSG